MVGKEGQNKDGGGSGGGVSHASDMPRPQQQLLRVPGAGQRRCSYPSDLASAQALHKDETASWLVISLAVLHPTGVTTTLRIDGVIPEHQTYSRILAGATVPEVPASISHLRAHTFTRAPPTQTQETPHFHGVRGNGSHVFLAKSIIPSSYSSTYRNCCPRAFQRSTSSVSGKIICMLTILILVPSTQ